MATCLTSTQLNPQQNASAVSRHSRLGSFHLRNSSIVVTLPPFYCHIHRPITSGLRPPPLSHQPRRRPIAVCQVSLVDDGPFVAAIATSIALSAAPLVLPSLPLLSGRAGKEDDDDAAAAAAAALLAAGVGVGDGKGGAEGEEAEGGMSLGELRAGVMTVVSLIPFFNWLCWVLAWIDSRDVKYILFAAVYAAPYARGGLTLAMDGHWLPLFSIAACALHVQVDNVAVERKKLASKIKCAKKKDSLPGSSKDKGSFKQGK
ncbi:hypothetical protein CLOM_g20302 [Closterium sp. NIES-68]|nr:hypothetical protein CLOM_g20302 [Closterium sp. NIES-68]GJP61750.1 hypothetical protein CLOP_g18887 [Closterium sp. NIES-67]